MTTCTYTHVLFFAPYTLYICDVLHCDIICFSPLLPPSEFDEQTHHSLPWAARAKLCTERRDTTASRKPTQFRTDCSEESLARQRGGNGSRVYINWHGRGVVAQQQQSVSTVLISENCSLLRWRDLFLGAFMKSAPILISIFEAQPGSSSEAGFLCSHPWLVASASRIATRVRLSVRVCMYLSIYHTHVGSTIQQYSAVVVSIILSYFGIQYSSSSRRSIIVQCYTTGIHVRHASHLQKASVCVCVCLIVHVRVFFF